MQVFLSRKTSSGCGRRPHRSAFACHPERPLFYHTQPPKRPFPHLRLAIDDLRLDGRFHHLSIQPHMHRITPRIGRSGPHPHNGIRPRHLDVYGEELEEWYDQNPAASFEEIELLHTGVF